MLEFSPTFRHVNARSGAALTAVRTSNQTIVEGSRMADAFKACSVDACNRNAHWRASGALGYCLPHYKKHRKYGDATAGAGRVSNDCACSVDGCDRPAKTVKLCNAHYLRLRTRGDVLGTGKAMRGDPALFLTSVAAAYDGDDCLPWPYSRNENGYGTLYAPKGETTVASRAVCELVHGPAPSDTHMAAHSCGKGHEGCVNPKHLRWATPLENSADKVIHGTASRKS